MSTSVHLQPFPDLSALPEEAQLVAQMDRVRDICTAALGVREKENMRVRQPLAKLGVYGEGVAALAAFADIIRDELNVKEVVFSEALKDVANPQLKIHFPVVGKRLGGKMKEVAAAAKAGDWVMLPGGRAQAGDEPLEPGEFEITLQPRPGIIGAQALSSNDALVVVDLAITLALRAEGIARDVVRLIQQARKDADLAITDRITLHLEVPEEVQQAVESNRKYVQEQTLTASLAFAPATGMQHKAEGETEGGKVLIGLAGV